jgi:predicted permease
MNWLKQLLLRRQVYDDLDQEIVLHLEERTEELVAGGMSVKEAAAAARREFGNAALLKETAREAWGWRSVEDLFADLRFALRTLRKNPGFTTTAILTLALGIGANTALYSVVNGVLLDPLPYPHPDQLVSLAERQSPFSHLAISYPDFLDWTRMNRTFQALAAYRHNDFNLTGSGEAQRVKATLVSASFFPLLGVKPLAGRNFSPDEDRSGAAPVVMLSASFWKSKFNASPAILGKSLVLDGVAYTIVGVIPQDFYFCCETTNFSLGDIYAPLGSWNTPWIEDRGAHPGIFALGRLNPGTALEQASSDMDQVANNLAVAYPDSNRGRGIALIPLKEEMVSNVRPVLLALLAAVGLVLLIACANVANILLARSTGRAQEFGIRTALGATRGRMTRQLLVESFVLAIAGGALGFLFASWSTRAALATLPQTLPRANYVRLDVHVLAFTLLVSVAAAALFGLAPILQISIRSVQTILKERARGASSPRYLVQRAFVALEIALAIVLLMAAGLTIRSLANLSTVKSGFDPRNVLTFTVALPGSTGKATPDQVRAYCNQLRGVIAGIPGVTAVSRTAGAFPMANGSLVGFWIGGRPRPTTQGEMPEAVSYIVGPDYWKTMGVPLRRGNFFTSFDNIHSRLVMVIDERFERWYFPNQNPIGQHIYLDGLDDPFEVVGVVGHVKQNGLDEDESSRETAQTYMSIDQIPDQFISILTKSAALVVRTRASSPAIADTIRSSIRRMSDQQVAYDFESMEEIVSDSLASRRFTMSLLTVFAALALLLAAIGVYGVISYVVGQRAHEIGIRMALGAEQEGIVLMVLRQAGMLLVLGVTVGLLASLGFSRLVASMLFRVNSYDPLTLAAVAGFLSAVALVACSIPARRASQVDPMVALRYE